MLGEQNVGQVKVDLLGDHPLLVAFNSSGCDPTHHHQKALP